MTKILIHSGVFRDIKLYRKKKWYKGLGKEMPGICRLLMRDNMMPGEKPVHYIKVVNLQGKTFHAAIKLPKENVGKRKGPRIIYIKENSDFIKIIYVGGHKDKRYDNSHLQVELIKERYLTENYIPYSENLDFNNNLTHI